MIFKVSEESLEALRRREPVNLVDACRGHLQNELPEFIEGVSRAGVDERIGNALTRGRLRGLWRGDDLMAFVGLSFQFAPNFDEQPRIRELIARFAGSDEAVMIKVAEYATDADWTDVIAKYDAAAWSSESSDE